MDIDIETFIMEVHNRPVIWDQKHKSYHNRIVVENTWKSIAVAMKQPKEKLKKKWKGIRDQFRTEFKKIPIGTAEKEYDTYTTWTHFPSLIFLKDQLKPRKSGGNLTAFIDEKQILKEEITINDIHDDTYNTYSDNLEYTQDSEQSTARTMQKKARPSSNGAEDRFEIEVRKLQLLEKKMRTQNERNDDEAFFDSLLPYMRSMDLNRKMLCRIEIQKAVYNYSFPVSGNTTSGTQYLSD